MNRREISTFLHMKHHDRHLQPACATYVEGCERGERLSVAVTSPQQYQSQPRWRALAVKKQSARQTSDRRHPVSRSLLFPPKDGVSGASAGRNLGDAEEGERHPEEEARGGAQKAE